MNSNDDTDDVYHSAQELDDDASASSSGGCIRDAPPIPSKQPDDGAVRPPLAAPAHKKNPSISAMIRQAVLPRATSAAVAAPADPQDESLVLGLEERHVKLWLPPDREANIHSCPFLLREIVDFRPCRLDSGRQETSTPRLKAGWFDAFFKTKVLIPIVLLNRRNDMPFRSLRKILEWPIGKNEGVSFHSAERRLLVDDEELLKYLIRPGTSLLYVALEGDARELVSPLFDDVVEPAQLSTTVQRHDDVLADPVREAVRPVLAPTTDADAPGSGCEFCPTTGLKRVADGSKRLFIVSLDRPQDLDLNELFRSKIDEIMDASHDEKGEVLSDRQRLGRVGKHVAAEVHTLFKNGQMHRLNEKVGAAWPLLPLDDCEKFVFKSEYQEHGAEFRLQRGGNFDVPEGTGSKRFTIHVYFCRHCREIKKFNWNGIFFPVCSEKEFYGPDNLKELSEQLLLLPTFEHVKSATEPCLSLPHEITYDFSSWLFKRVKILCQSDGVHKRINGPAVVFADNHGEMIPIQQLVDMSRSQGSLVFLGNFVDRGPNSSNVVHWLGLAKLLKPDRVFILRGNHETRLVNGKQGATLRSECRQRFGDQGEQWWELFNSFFDGLPYCVSIHMKSDDAAKGIVCMHGGPCPSNHCLDSLNGMKPEARENDLRHLMSSGPTDRIAVGWAFGDRGRAGIGYSREVLEDFLRQNSMKKLLRGHGETHGQGFHEMWDEQVTSIQSSLASGESCACASVDKDLNVLCLKWSRRTVRPTSDNQSSYVGSL